MSVREIVQYPAPAKVIDLSVARKVRYKRSMDEIGARALIRAKLKNDLSVIIPSKSFWPIEILSEDQHLFLEALKQASTTIYSFGNIAIKDLVSYMQQPEKRYLRHFRPLDLCIVEAPELAQEAGLCYLDKSHEFGFGIPDIDNQAKRAFDKLDQLLPQAIPLSKFND